MGVEVITIRRFDQADVEAAVALEEACQPQPWTRKIFEDELGADNRSYWVAEDEELVGFGGIMVIGEEAHINNLLVAPEWRRQGVGSRLMTRLITEAREAGARHLTLEVRAGNRAAHGLYRRFGLAPVGVRPDYYKGEDALIMWAHDIDSPEYARRLT